MRREATRLLKDLRWLTEADRYLARARDDLRRNPADDQLRELIRVMQEAVANERGKLLADAAIRPGDNAAPDRSVG